MAISDITVYSLLLLFKKCLRNGGLLRNAIIGQSGMRGLSSHITSLAILRRGKAGLPPGRMTTLFQVGEEPVVLFLRWGKSEHTMFISSIRDVLCGRQVIFHHVTSFWMKAAGGQDRKLQILRMRQGFPRAAIGSLDL